MKSSDTYTILVSLKIIRLTYNHGCLLIRTKNVHTEIQTLYAYRKDKYIAK